MRTTAAALSTPTGAMWEPRVEHQSVALTDGRVLVTGGIKGVGGGGTTGVTELYQPATNDWYYSGSLNTPRWDFSATRLSNGKVLAAEGVGSAVFASAELFDPATNLWSMTGSMATPRSGHTATLLTDGRVLVTGGQLANASNTQTAELYNPSTGSWSTAAPMSYTRITHTATRLSCGGVQPVGEHLDQRWQHPSATRCERRGAPALGQGARGGRQHLAHDRRAV